MENISTEATPHEATLHEAPLAANNSRRQMFSRAGALVGTAALGAAVLGRRANAQTTSNEVIIMPEAGATTGTGMAGDSGMAGGTGMAGDSGMMGTGMAGGTGMMGTGMAAGATPSNPFGDLAMLKSDVDIFNFALILEYLEADFYTRAVNAQTQRAFLKGRIPEVAQKLATDENTHVAAIITRIGQLGGTPVASPAFQFPSEAFISEVAFLDFSATLEQTGVHAYLGAAPKIKSHDNLRFAVSIYGIEARHTGLIRLLGGRTFSPDSVESPLPASEIVTAVLPFIIASA